MVGEIFEHEGTTVVVSLPSSIFTGFLVLTLPSSELSFTRLHWTFFPQGSRHAIIKPLWKKSSYANLDGSIRALWQLAQSMGSLIIEESCQFRSIFQTLLWGMQGAPGACAFHHPSFQGWNPSTINFNFLFAVPQFAESLIMKQCSKELKLEVNEKLWLTSCVLYPASWVMSKRLCFIAFCDGSEIPIVFHLLLQQRAVLPVLYLKFASVDFVSKA